MQSRPKREEVITFKVDGALAEALSGISNRSDFIRRAILEALGNSCPVCQGTGRLTVKQMEHWQEFNRHHHVEQCETCHEAHLVCDHEVVGAH